MAKKRSANTYINLISSVGVMVVNLFISFWLSPYIIRTIGVEAHGFVSLANNFVTYANLVVTALNAMAARFVTVAYVQQDYKRANVYYNSVFWGNLIIVAVLLIPAAVFVNQLEKIITVPVEIVTDVKILFSLVFLSFFIRTGAPNWDCGTYVTNRLDLSYVPNMFTAVLRCVLLVCMFSFWTPHVWYVSFTSFLIGLITLGIAGYWTHKLTPELQISLRKPICSWKAVWELVGSGIWSSIAIAGNMLLTGLDLLVCNVFLGATAMGLLSLSKTLPGILIQLAESIRGVFGPEMTIQYAKGDTKSLIYSIRRAMKITSVVLTIPTAGLVVMSDLFYKLWVPSQNSQLLRTLTVLAILSYLVNSGVVALFNVFSATNHVRYNSVAMIVSGLVSVAVSVALIYLTEWDLYVIASVSSIVTILKNLIFTIPVASKLLGLKWYTFYPQVGQSILSSAVIIGIGVLVRWIIPVGNWIMFFAAAAIIAILGLGANMLIVLNKEERVGLLEIIKRKLFRVKK